MSLENKIEKFEDFFDAIMFDSVVMFRDEKNFEDYLNDEELSDMDKETDLDNLIKWAEKLELYEDCANLKKLKDGIVR